MPDSGRPAASTALLKRAASIPHLAEIAQRKLPRFVWDYLVRGCAGEVNVEANRQALDAVQLCPRYLQPCGETTLDTSLFGTAYSAPFGVAPLGLSGLICPSASVHHAQAATSLGLPFILSTMSTSAIEDIADTIKSPFWFQLYPPADTHIRDDLLARAREAGVDVLVVTVDVPTPGRRPADIRSGLAVPPRIDLKSIWQSVSHPWWALSQARQGLPVFANLDPYLNQGNLKRTASEIRFALRTPVDDSVIQDLRGRWQGPLVVKGILHPEDAKAAVACGADGVIVSNHGGRQNDASPASADALPAIVDAVGRQCTVMVDGGVQSGTDIARYLSLGAESVFCGRAIAHGSAALGQVGADHSLRLLWEELFQTIMQLRCETPQGLPSRLHPVRTEKQS